MVTRLRISISDLSTNKAAIGGETVHFTRHGRDWLSEPVSDVVASAVVGHPHFEVVGTDSDEPLTEVEIDPMVVDFTNEHEVTRLLIGIPRANLGVAVGGFPGIGDVLVRAVSEDALRDVVRNEVDPSDLVEYLEDPIPVLRNWIVANASRLSARRDAFVTAVSHEDGEPRGNGGVRSEDDCSDLGALGASAEGKTLTEVQRAVLARLGLSAGRVADVKAADEPKAGITPPDTNAEAKADSKPEAKVSIQDALGDAITAAVQRKTKEPKADGKLDVLGDVPGNSK